MAEFIFVPVALSEDEAKAVINACGATMVSLAGAISAEHPLVSGALKIEAAWCKATGQPATDPEPGLTAG